MSVVNFDKNAIPWTIIKNKFMYGMKQVNGQIRHTTFQDLIEEFDIKLATLKTKATRENWIEQRNSFLEKIEEAAYQHKQQQLKGQIIKFDEQVFQITCNAVDQLSAKQYTIEQTTDDEGNIVDKQVLNMGLPTLEIRRILEATDLAYKIRSGAMGDIAANANEDSINKLVDIIQLEREAV